MIYKCMHLLLLASVLSLYLLTQQLPIYPYTSPINPSQTNPRSTSTRPPKKTSTDTQSKNPPTNNTCSTP